MALRLRRGYADLESRRREPGKADASACLSVTEAWHDMHSICRVCPLIHIVQLMTMGHESLATVAVVAPLLLVDMLMVVAPLTLMVDKVAVVV